MDKSKKIRLVVIGSLIVLCIILIIIKMFVDKKHIEHIVFTGEITLVTPNVLTARDINDGSYYSVEYKTGNYEVGQVIVVYTKDPIRESYPAQVIASKILLATNNNSNEQSSNQSTNNGNNSTSTNNNSSSSNNSNSNSSSTKKTEKDVINYFDSLNNDLDTKNKSDSLSKSIKNGFVTTIDFLFYKGEIHGYKFSELSNSAKLTVLKAALSIDEKIDKHFPGYKESISKTTNKVYTNIKHLIVTEYLNITTAICEKEEALCESAKDGFSEIKKAFNLTWDFIKDLATSGIDKLDSWYKIWKHK